MYVFRKHGQNCGQVMSYFSNNGFVVAVEIKMTSGLKNKSDMGMNDLTEIHYYSFPHCLALEELIFATVSSFSLFCEE